MEKVRSKDLAEAFGIGIPKWKRWAREFLGPGPGKVMRGYGREYTALDALRVYLGGVLVSEKALGVEEAKRAIKELWSWLEVQGYFESPLNGYFEHDPPEVKEWVIAIQRLRDGRLQFLAKGILKCEQIRREGTRLVWQETYFHEPIGAWQSIDIISEAILNPDSEIKAFWLLWNRLKKD